MKRWSFVFLALAILALTWNWGQGGWVRDIDESAYSAGATAIGDSVYNHLMAIVNVVNGALADTNIQEGADIQGDKLLYNDMHPNRIEKNGFDSLYVDSLFNTAAFCYTNMADILADSTFNKGLVDSIWQNHTVDLDKLERAVGYFPNIYAPKKVAYGDVHIHYSCPVAALNLADTLLPDTSFVFMIDFWDSSDVGNPGFAATPNIILGPVEIVTETLFKDQTTTIFRDDTASGLHFTLAYASANSCSVYVHYDGSDTLALSHKLYWEARE